MSAYHSRGYIALVSALIISAILTSLVFETSSRAFFARSAQVDVEQHVQSALFAGSCAYIALRSYIDDVPYTPREQLVYLDANDTCVIDYLSATDDHIQVYTHAVYQGSYAALSVTAQSTNSTAPVHIISWKEITSIPP